jgi:acetoacetyl-CoA synthetase
MTLSYGDVLARPTATAVAAARLTDFRERVNARFGLALADYDALHAWSITAIDDFWQLLWEEGGVIASERGPTRRGDATMIDTRFFPAARLNYAENLLAPAARDPAAIALIERDESPRRRDLSRAALTHAVARAVAALRSYGIERGDRVAAYVANGIDAVVAHLACAAIGAIWTSTSPDFGVAATVDRFAQVEPALLIAVDGYRYGGKRHDVRDRVAAIAARLPTLRAVLIQPFLEDAPDLRAIHRATLWSDALPDVPPPLTFEQVPFDHPLAILYSSGTTGVPKAIVHGHGGTLLQHLKEHLLHVDLRERDRLLYLTTCGWMMWNWQLSALATGACLVLYDGSPFAPESAAAWRLAESERVTVFGTSAKMLSAAAASGVAPREQADLSAIRLLLSTGSPLAPEGFAFAARDVAPGAQIASISGGTDIVSCFALGSPLHPVRAGVLACFGLGMAVDVVDARGEPTLAAGELVCRAPFPSMPVGFWGDADRSRYRAAYFERFPGIWAHGDFARRSEGGGLVILGRSDATLNPGGVRIGSAEITRIAERAPEVAEALCIGQPWRDDQRIVLFVRLAPGAILDDALRARLRAAIRADASPRHVPAVIAAVADLPRTRSGKLAERAVLSVVTGSVVDNRDALANPESLDLFAAHPDLA